VSQQKIWTRKNAEMALIAWWVTFAKKPSKFMYLLMDTSFAKKRCEKCAARPKYKWFFAKHGIKWSLFVQTLLTSELSEDYFTHLPKELTFVHDYTYVCRRRNFDLYIQFQPYDWS
jgi:hypothetical protein